MAGDWIKMRLSLVTHPKVMRIAECLVENRDYLDWSSLHWAVQGYPPNADKDKQERYDALRITRYVTVCALLRFWGYANEHIKEDETIYGLWPDDIDQIAGVPGFAEAMGAVGWIEHDPDGGATKLPNFGEHNVSGASRGSTNAERQRRYRERKKEHGSNVTRDVTSNAREEKRRDKQDIPPTGGSTVWDFGRSLLIEQGLSSQSAGALIGSWLRDWTEPDVAEALRLAAGKADVRSYVAAVLKAKPKKNVVGERTVAL